MLPMEISEIGTQEKIQISQNNPSMSNRLRRPIRSRTAETFFRIMSICYGDHFNVFQDSDTGGTHIGSVTKDDVPLAHTDIVPNDSLCQGEMSVDETRTALGTQEGGLYTKHVQSTACDDNISGEGKDLSYRVDTNPSNSFDNKNQDNFATVSSTLRTGDEKSTPVTPISLTDTMISSPHLLTDKDVEEGEISREFMDFMLEDDTSSVDKTGSEPEAVIGIKRGHASDNNLIPLSTDTVDIVGKDMAVVVNRKLVDYSEISVRPERPKRLHGRLETTKSAKRGTAAIESDRAPLCPEHVSPLESNLKSSATKIQDFASPVKDSGAQNNKKRKGSCTEEKRTNKKRSVDSTTRLESLTVLCEHPEDVSQEIVNASANKDAGDEKKKKRVLTKERKAKKKHKDRIKRAEKNRKLGVKRLKIQPVIKEKKITYCRHYMMGRCHEGEKCKFSHDTIPLTKSKPCCHFARHSCMKGDDCPFDHQLSKYPCNNLLTKGFCSRGSDCMFSHEAQPSEASLNASNESKPEQKSSFLDNSGSKKCNSIDDSSSEKMDKKSCSTPMSVTSNKQNLVSARPPKGISFLSQEKSPLESCMSPEVKGCEIISSGSDLVQDFKELTKKPLVVPRGINFLSFGKKPGLDGGFSFKIGNGIGKSPLSNMGSKSESTDDKQMNPDIPTERASCSEQPMLIKLPFMSSTSQKALQSTLAFASKFEPGMKARVAEHKL